MIGAQLLPFSVGTVWIEATSRHQKCEVVLVGHDQSCSNGSGSCRERPTSPSVLWWMTHGRKSWMAVSHATRKSVSYFPWHVQRRTQAPFEVKTKEEIISPKGGGIRPMSSILLRSYKPFDRDKQRGAVIWTNRSLLWASSLDWVQQDWIWFEANDRGYRLIDHHERDYKTSGSGRLLLMGMAQHRL